MKVIIEIEPELFNNVVERTIQGDYMSDVWLAVGHGKPYEERPQGKWIEKHNYLSLVYHVCSICRQEPLELEEYESLSNFCPNCGADMRGDNNAN